jgi:hypothetical protein
VLASICDPLPLSPPARAILACRANPACRYDSTIVRRLVHGTAGVRERRAWDARNTASISSADGFPAATRRRYVALIANIVFSSDADIDYDTDLIAVAGVDKTSPDFAMSKPSGVADISRIY